MTHYVLDTSALLTLRDDEPGADTVADLLYLAQRGDDVCLASFMTQMELLYRVWRDEGEAAGRLALEQCMAMPIVWVQVEQPLLEKAAEIKATHRISVVDAWISATAILRGAMLVHKDPEMEPIACPQLPLPYKQADSPQTADPG
jgi:predicted nucleic acid-binding protein